jgi:hypothetical protein
MKVGGRRKGEGREVQWASPRRRRMQALSIADHYRLSSDPGRGAHSRPPYASLLLLPAVRGNEAG